MLNEETVAGSYRPLSNHGPSVGHQEWDCIAIPPSVADASLAAEAQDRDRLARDIIWAQDLATVDRAPGDTRPAAEIFKEWLKEQMGR